MIKKDQPQVQPEEQTIPITPSQQPAQTPPKPKPKESTKFSDVLAFSGPAPERINGRLAMVGFVLALAVELARGDDLATQLMNAACHGTIALLSIASLMLLFKDISAQSKSGGLMIADTEPWNGRFAMLGLVALAFTEYLKGDPLV